MASEETKKDIPATRLRYELGGVIMIDTRNNHIHLRRFLGNDLPDGSFHATEEVVLDSRAEGGIYYDLRDYILPPEVLQGILQRADNAILWKLEKDKGMAPKELQDDIEKFKEDPKPKYDADPGTVDSGTAKKPEKPVVEISPAPDELISIGTGEPEPEPDPAPK